MSHIELEINAKERAANLNYSSQEKGKMEVLIVKKLLPDHDCYKVFNNSLATAHFLAIEFKQDLYENPSMKVTEMMKKARTSYMNLNVSHIKCKRVKLEGSYMVEFSQLAAYAAAIIKKNESW